MEDNCGSDREDRLLQDGQTNGLTVDDGQCPSPTDGGAGQVNVKGEDMRRVPIALYILALLVSAAGLLQGCRDRPDEQSLSLDKTVILRKGEYQLAVVLREVLQNWDRVLVVSVQNMGSAPYEGFCNTFFSIPEKGDGEFMVVFTPKTTDAPAIRRGENERGRLVLEYRITPLTLNAGEKAELVGHRSLNVRRENVHQKFRGRLYQKSNPDNEVELARAGEEAFKRGDYKAARDYLNRARAVQQFGVWQSSYPYFAGAYWHLGERDEAKRILDEMLVLIDSSEPGYLNADSPLGFVTNSLLRVRDSLPPSDQEQWNSVITHVTDRRVDIIRQDVLTAETYSPTVETAGVESGTELWYCYKGNKAFVDGGYSEALDYYNRARSASTSGVWQSSYPYIAGCYRLLGNRGKSEAVLDEMLATVRANDRGYLSDEVPLGDVVNSLLNVRERIMPGDQREAWDRCIKLVTDRRIEVIRNDVNSGITY